MVEARLGGSIGPTIAPAEPAGHEDLQSIPVREFVFLNIKLKATCPNVRRERLSRADCCLCISRLMRASIPTL